MAREEKSLEAQQTQAVDCAEIDMYLAMVRVSNRGVGRYLGQVEPCTAVVRIEYPMVIA